MKRKSVFSILVLITMLLFITFFCDKSFAESTDLLPSVSNNIEAKAGRYSSLVKISSGYMRVFYDNINQKIGVEYYDNIFNITKKKKLDMELSIYGGFHAGNDGYYYVVEGQNNKEDDYNKEVIRIIKYNTNWERVNSAKITSKTYSGRVDDLYAEIGYPFDNGCLEITETNGKLYIVTGHESFVEKGGVIRHQGLLMIEVDTSSMNASIVDADNWHSFAQYIENKDDSLYLLEQSEGGRCTILSKYDKNNISEKPVAIKLLEYGGSHTSSRAIFCYASVDGIALSNDKILTVGTSIDQKRYDEAYSSKLAHNIYLTITPMNDFTEKATTFKWITNYSKDFYAFTDLELVKINDNKFMIMWEEFEERKNAIDNDTLSNKVLHCQCIDSNGNKIGNEYKFQASMSDCKPIVVNDKVVFYTSNDNMVDFYTIDLNGNLSKKMYRVVGENAIWSLDGNGTLTISGKGKISMDEGDGKYKFPLSSVQDWYTTTIDGLSWNAIESSIKEIVIEEGLTSLPDECFGCLTKASSVYLPSTMKTIGKNVFKYCDKITKICIPSSVTSIGEDFLYTGLTWVGSGNKVYYATIYTSKGSYAEKYAKTNGIRCENIGWYQENGNWYYKNNLGVMPKSCWEFIDGKWYYFESSGVMISNCWKFIQNKWYCFDNSGAMMSNSWSFDGEKWYYLDANGVMITNNWLLDGGKWYYLNGSGVMLSNCWQLIKGKWYYFENSGAMVSNGWREIKNKWYYFENSGAMVSNGWKEIKNKWYYFESSGAMISNCWKEIGNKWYYFEDSGAIASNGWREIKTKWYYFDSDGVMYENQWLYDYKGYDYYFDGNGYMVTDKINYKIGEEYYDFDSEGRCLEEIN